MRHVVVTPTRVGSYDYVVVGAGTAGCVLAHRLSADESASVLVLEAGEPDDRREIHVPAAFSELFQSDYDWAYTTEPQPGLDGREEYWPRGRVLGGTSAINAMIHVRGHPSDFDGWADRGNDGWAYDDVLPYFKRSERFVGSGGDPGYHGTDGPLYVADQPDPRSISETFVAAGRAVGYDANPDFNAERQAGVGLYHVNVKDGRRHSAADAYLKPVLDRPNLEVETGALVTQVLLEDGRVDAVAFRKDGRDFRVDVANEAVLAGGTVNSPQLLMLSGIGPADHLRGHDIPVERDLRGVGRNLQDHLVMGVNYAAQTRTLDDADSLRRLPINVAKYALLNTGPLTSILGEGGGFIHLDDTTSAPELKLVFVPAHFRNHGFDHPGSGNWFSLGTTLLQPESRGRVTLRSADPTHAPAIDPNYLDAPADLEALVEGLRLAREVIRASPFDDVRGEEAYPGDDVETDDEIAAAVRAKAQTEYHPVGTCRMGDGEDAVVDDRLRVHGIEGLRVVDASVMPRITNGNTNAPTVMIAERGADLIRNAA